MKKKYYVIHFIVFLLVVYFSFHSYEKNPMTDYLTVMKDMSVNKLDKNDPLYKEIVEKAKEFELEPKDAKIDKVWKKMPGINGLKVNIDKSYVSMKKQNKFDEKLLVYEQVSPSKHLQDLEAAPIYRGHPEKQMVAFLINVSWGEEHIPEMLKELRKHKVKATFFIDGAWAQKNVDILKMIEEEGHEIGSHGYNHPNMSRLSKDEITEQLVKTNNIINSITGKVPVYFAPPAGNFNDQVVQIAHQHKMETILWTVDTVDWKNPTKEVLLERVMSKLEPGSMILMHPKEVTKQALDSLILKIKEKNYKIGTVSKLLDEERSK